MCPMPTSALAASVTAMASRPTATAAAARAPQPPVGSSTSSASIGQVGWGTSRRAAWCGVAGGRWRNGGGGCGAPGGGAVPFYRRYRMLTLMGGGERAAMRQESGATYT